jgi:fumarate reductase subunit C
MRAPNTYSHPMTGWWLKNPFFIRYMIREGTSVFMAVYSVILLVGLASLTAGEVSYDAWLAGLKSPLSVLFHVLALAAAIYHTVTWFAVSPKAKPPVYLGKEPVPASVIIGGQYAGFIAVSIIVFAVAWA